MYISYEYHQGIRISTCLGLYHHKHVVEARNEIVSLKIMSVVPTDDVRTWSPDCGVLSGGEVVIVYPQLPKYGSVKEGMNLVES